MKRAGLALDGLIPLGPFVVVVIHFSSASDKELATFDVAELNG